MSDVTILCGLPASGKSTLATAMLDWFPHTVIVSTDRIRQELCGDESNQALNAEVFALATRRLHRHLSDGWDVIVDATNLTAQERQRWIAAAREEGAVWHVVDIPTPFIVCLWRNWRRQRTVPFRVMWRMWKNQRADRKERRR